MTNSTFQWAQPWLFWLLLLLPILIWWDFRKRRAMPLDFSDVKLLKTATKASWKIRTEILVSLLKGLALAALVVAMARPQTVNEYHDINGEGIDILLTLDTSYSMLVLDMQKDGEETNRMTIVKDVVQDFVKGRQFDRIGMVVFGDRAYTQCPLTLDYDVLTSFLDLVDVGIAGRGTAIGNALALSVKRLVKSEAKSKVIILVTDGKNEAGEISPKGAALAAKEHGIRVYTIGVGSDQKFVHIPVQTPFGWKRQRQANLEVDKETLQEIADLTGGKFFEAQTTEALENVYRQIDELEKSDVETREFSQTKEHYDLFVALSLFLYLLQWALRRFVYFRAV